MCTTIKVPKAVGIRKERGMIGQRLVGRSGNTPYSSRFSGGGEILKERKGKESVSPSSESQSHMDGRLLHFTSRCCSLGFWYQLVVANNT